MRCRRRHIQGEGEKDCFTMAGGKIPKNHSSTTPWRWKAGKRWKGLHVSLFFCKARVILHPIKVTAGSKTLQPARLSPSATLPMRAQEGSTPAIRSRPVEGIFSRSAFRAPYLSDKAARAIVYAPFRPKYTSRNHKM